MTNEEFIRKYQCGQCEVSLYCETNNSFCFTAEAMLKAAEWRENNPDGLVVTLDGFIHKNYCVSCGNNCVFFDVNKNCTTTRAILKMIEWKDEERKRCWEFLGIFFLCFPLFILSFSIWGASPPNLRPTFVCHQQKWAKMPLGSLRNFK